MKFKKLIAIFLATLMLMTGLTSLAFASDASEENEQKFELILYNDDGSTVKPRINADGSFTYSFTSRLHSGHFTATANKISLSFITSTNSRAYYYIALYDVTDDPVNPTFKSMTQSKDNNNADSKTFNVTEGREYRLTFEKVNPNNLDWVTGKGTIQGITV